MSAVWYVGLVLVLTVDVLALVLRTAVLLTSLQNLKCRFKLLRVVDKNNVTFYCATHIMHSAYLLRQRGWLGGWLAVRHMPVLYQNG